MRMLKFFLCIVIFSLSAFYAQCKDELGFAEGDETGSMRIAKYSSRLVAMLKFWGST